MAKNAETATVVARSKMFDRLSVIKRRPNDGTFRNLLFQALLYCEFASTGGMQDEATRIREEILEDLRKVVMSMDTLHKSVPHKVDGSYNVVPPFYASAFEEAIETYNDNLAAELLRITGKATYEAVNDNILVKGMQETNEEHPGMVITLPATINDNMLQLTLYKLVVLKNIEGIVNFVTIVWPELPSWYGTLRTFEQTTHPVLAEREKSPKLG